MAVCESPWPWYAWIFASLPLAFVLFMLWLLVTGKRITLNKKF